jgi:hypothetical protein
MSRHQAFMESNTLMSNPNPITDAVVDANDEAVAMLRNGDNDHALASFQRALEVIQQYVSMYSFPEELEDITCHYSPTQPLRVEQQGSVDENGRETNRIIVSVALGDYGFVERQSATTPENLFSFFNHAFLFIFRPSMAMGSSQQETYFNMLTTVLVFNMALTQHRRGLVDEHNSSQILRKAIRLYQLATTTSLLTNQGDFQDLHAIQLASWNNVGHIYSHFSEHENAMKCRVHLYQALFADSDTSLRLTYGYSYSLFYLFVVSSEVRRREMRFNLPTSSAMTTSKMSC